MCLTRVRAKLCRDSDPPGPSLGNPDVKLILDRDLFEKKDGRFGN